MSFHSKKGSLPFLFIFIFLTASLQAQQYSFINYSIENGLAQSQVQTIFQDKKGYLWFGTYGGLTRYDGKNFVNYSKDNGLLDNRINSIVEDHNQQMWIGTTGGINRFDGKNFKKFVLSPELSKNQVTSISLDPEIGLWLGTDGGGVCHFDGKSFTYFTEKDGLLNNYVRSVCSDGKGNTWFGTRKGLCYYNGNSFRQLDTSIIQPHNVSQIILDKSGSLWISTYGDGVYQMKGDRFINYNESLGLVKDWIRSVMQDNIGNLWFASKNGVSKFDGKSFLNFNTLNGLMYSNINIVMQDVEGNIWFGTDGNGVLKFTGETFVSYTTSEGLSNNIIISVNQDTEQNLWFGTYGNGVCRFDGNTFKVFTTAEGLNNNIVWASITDRSQNVWFGTAEGASKYDGKQFTSYTSKEGLGAKTVYALLEDSKGNLWMGTTAGVSMFNGKEFTNYASGKDEIGKNVKSILEDKNKNLWFATSSGLYKYDGFKFMNYTTKAGLSDNNVVSILKDKNENLWIGTVNGLNIFDGKSFKQIPIDEPYNSNYINFMVFGSDGHLWVGTNNGIYETDSKQYLLTGKASFTHYSNNEGLRSLECNQNAAFRDKQGNLWFGTSEGVLKYNSNRNRTGGKLLEPMTLITGVRLFLQPTDWSKYAKEVSPSTGLPLDLVVNYKKNYFTFDYIGISLSNPVEVKYKFLLEGFDQDWSPPTDATFATYSNLPYGKYTFKVIACNKNDEWNTVPVTFSFEITRPFWMTWWFYLLCFLFASAITWIIYRSRVAALQRKHDTQQLEYTSKLLALEHQTLNASMNRHFIFNALNSIQYYINKQDKLSANKYLTSFAKLIRKNLDSSQSNLVPLSEEMERLKLYLELEHMRFEKKFEYKINIHEDIDTEIIEIPPMLLQPYVENSIWHGILPLESPGRINISVTPATDDTVLFVIEDNGIGIEKSMSSKDKNGQLHISRGMEITSGRINLLRTMTNSTISVKGPFDLKNGSGMTIGTRVEITLPLKNYF